MSFIQVILIVLLSLFIGCIGMCIGFFMAALMHSASTYSREGEDE